MSSEIYLILVLVTFWPLTKKLHSKKDLKQQKDKKYFHANDFLVFNIQKTYTLKPVNFTWNLQKRNGTTIMNQSLSITSKQIKNTSKISELEIIDRRSSICSQAVIRGLYGMPALNVCFVGNNAPFSLPCTLSFYYILLYIWTSITTT